MLKKFLIILLILIIIIGFVRFLNVFNVGKKTQNFKQTLDYKNQITDLVVKEFGVNNQLSKKIIAKKWTTFDHKEHLIKQPKIQISTDKNLQIISDFAKNIDTTTMELIGNVEFVRGGIKTYKLNTQSLFADTKNSYFYSEKKVKYFSFNNTITSQGINIFLNNKKVELLKNSTILFANGNKIIGKNIQIIQKNDLDYTTSVEPTEFINNTTTVQSNKGFSIYKDQINLLGKSTIKQKDTLIYAKNLYIINNIYTAKQTEYNKERVKVNADNLQLDENKQVIELTGNVKGVYE